MSATQPSTRHPRKSSPAAQTSKRGYGPTEKRRELGFQQNLPRAYSTIPHGPTTGTIAFYGVDFKIPAVPLPTQAPITAHPVMTGRSDFDEFTGINSAEGSWAKTRARLTEGSIEFTRGTFYLCGSPGGGGHGVVRFPHSGKYQRGVWVIAGAGHSLFEFKEKDVHIEFERNSDGGWNVHGHG